MKFHVANCPAMFKGVGVDLDYVRPGICIYGLPPGELIDCPYVVTGTRSAIIYVMLFFITLLLLHAMDTKLTETIHSDLFIYLFIYFMIYCIYVNIGAMIMGMIKMPKVLMRQIGVVVVVVILMAFVPLLLLLQIMMTL